MRILSVALLLLGVVSTSTHADTQSPSTITNVQVSSISANAVQVTWNTPWDNVGVDGYNIYRNGSYYRTIGNATNYIDTDVSPGTRYEYAVVAFDKARNYSPMSVGAATTSSNADDNKASAAAAAPQKTDAAPEAPSNVRAEVLNSNSIQLQWDASSNASGYNVYLDGNYHKTIRGSAGYTAKSLSSGREYRWQIVAFSGQQFSLKSAELLTNTGDSSTVAAAPSEDPVLVLAPELAPEPEPAAESSGIPSGYKLVFSDEFRGSSLDQSKWSSRYRWGPWWTINDEKQFYVDSLNTPGFGFTPFEFDGENLTINAVKTPSNLKGKANNQNYLSGALTTFQKFKMRYGYVEMRARMPKGKGLWPAFWLLHNGNNGRRPEIDVVEMLGDQTDRVYQTYHYYDNKGALRSSESLKVWDRDFSNDFHTYGMKWEPGRITWYVDGEARNTYTNSNVSSEDMYLLVNLAVGGSWPGSPDNSTQFPAKYTIDYIRAYSPN